MYLSVYLVVCAKVTPTSSRTGLWASRACMSRAATEKIHIVYICICFPVMDLHPAQLARGARLRPLMLFAWVLSVSVCWSVWLAMCMYAYVYIIVSVLCIYMCILYIYMCNIYIIIHIIYILYNMCVYCCIYVCACLLGVHPCWLNPLVWSCSSLACLRILDFAFEEFV